MTKHFVFGSCKIDWFCWQTTNKTERERVKEKRVKEKRERERGGGTHLKEQNTRQFPDVNDSWARCLPPFVPSLFPPAFSHLIALKSAQAWIHSIHSIMQSLTHAFAHSFSYSRAKKTPTQSGQSNECAFTAVSKSWTEMTKQKEGTHNAYHMTYMYMHIYIYIIYISAPYHLFPHCRIAEERDLHS